MGTRPTFDTVWHRIAAYAGQTFHQIRGGEFTYEVTSAGLDLSRTNQTLSQATVKEAYGLVPLENTMPLQHLRGPSYLYAILMDPRIRNDDW